MRHSLMFDGFTRGEPLAKLSDFTVTRTVHKKLDTVSGGVTWVDVAVDFPFAKVHAATEAAKAAPVPHNYLNAATLPVGDSKIRRLKPEDFAISSPAVFAVTGCDADGNVTSTIVTSPTGAWPILEANSGCDMVAPELLAEWKCRTDLAKEMSDNVFAEPQKPAEKITFSTAARSFAIPLDAFADAVKFWTDATATHKRNNESAMALINTDMYNNDITISTTCVPSTVDGANLWWGINSTGPLKTA